MESLDLYLTDSILECNALGSAFKFSLEKIQSTKQTWNEKQEKRINNLSAISEDILKQH